MKPTVMDVLAYELKKEVAERYFGFRKLIEEDKLELADKIRQFSFILEKRISFDLIRIYILLKDYELIKAFLKLINLEEELFYDSYLTESQKIKERVFEGLSVRGLTRYNCFYNLVEDCYERLLFHTDRYREKFDELLVDHDNLKEEIKVYYRRNDFGSIMGFLRSLGDVDRSGGMQGGMEIGLVQELEKKMQIETPPPIEHYLPVIPPLPPFKSIVSDLKPLIKRAFQLHDKGFVDEIVARASFPDWR